MSSFTIFLLILIIVAAFFGWRSGLMKQIGQIAGIILGIAACRIFGDQAVAMLCNAETGGTDRVLYTILAYVLLFAIVYILVFILVRLIRKIFGFVKLGFIDSISGAIFRIVEWLLILSLVLNLWVAIWPDTSLTADPTFDKVLWFGPYLLGTDAASFLGNAVGTAISG